MLETAVATFGDQSYCWRKTDAGWTPTGFRAASERAVLVARALRARGVGSDRTVAIVAEGSPEWVTFELGVLANKCASVPLSIKLLPEEVPFRVNHAECVALGVSYNQVKKLASVYAQLERKPFIVLLEDTDAMVGEAKALLPEAGIVGLQALIEEGRNAGEQVVREQAAAMDEVDEDTTATVSYTSGTTGNPKGIMLTHLNYWSNCTDSIAYFRIPRGYSTLVILPCDHSFAHTVGLYAALIQGIQLYFVDARGGGMAILRNIPSNILESNPVFMLTVPSLSGNFMKNIIAGVESKGAFAAGIFKAGVAAGIRRNGDGYNRPGPLVQLATFLPWFIAEKLVFGKVRKVFGTRIKFFVGGGALLDRGQQEFFMAIGLPVFQGYGLTEAAPVISTNTPHMHKLGTSGRVLPNLECRIMKADGSEAVRGELGEICVRGDNVMAGYLKNEAASASALRDGWLYSGDLGYFDGDGFLMVTGREKALLIATDGEKYSPETIEETIATTSDLVAQVVAYNEHRKYTVAVCTLDEAKVRELVKRGGAPSAEELLQRIEDSFYSYKERGIRFPAQWTPSTFIIAPEPFTEANRMVNSTMKIVRHAVIEAYADDIEYLYTEEGHAIRNPRNLERVGRLLA
jgi:long-chain acyl-CoA synthetase